MVDLRGRSRRWWLGRHRLLEALDHTLQRCVYGLGEGVVPASDLCRVPSWSPHLLRREEADLSLPVIGSESCI
jgi:hypothetical protein